MNNNENILDQTHLYVSINIPMCNPCGVYLLCGVFQCDGYFIQRGNKVLQPKLLP